MESSLSIVQKSTQWRLWHAFNSFIGGGTFLVGSIVLFPAFNQYLDSNSISAWLFIIGSLAFVVVNLVEWLSYLNYKRRHISHAIIHLISLASTLFYLTGSTHLLPGSNYLRFNRGRFDQGMDFFLQGSVCLILSHICKLVATFRQKGKGFRQLWKEDRTMVLIDLLSMMGGKVYCLGIILLKKSVDQPLLLNEAVLLFSLGGLLFFASSCYTHKLYFWQRTSHKISSQEGESLPSIEL